MRRSETRRERVGSNSGSGLRGSGRGSRQSGSSFRHTTLVGRLPHPSISLSEIDGAKILVIADIHGNLNELNVLADQTNADAIFHVGEFGFYDQKTFDSLSDRALRNLVVYSPLIQQALAAAQGTGSALDISMTSSIPKVRQAIAQHDKFLLSQLPEYVRGEKKLNVPVYTTWGHTEDIKVLEKFRRGEYTVPNLYLVTDDQSFLLPIGDVKFRIFGLGGAFLPVKLLDSGRGESTIAGAAGECWITMLQMGKLIANARSVHDRNETRVLLSHAAVGREGVLTQLAVELQADFTVSGGLHCRYNVNYNEYATASTVLTFIDRLIQARESFNQYWDFVSEEVEAQASGEHKALLANVVNMMQSIPSDTQAMVPDVLKNAFRSLWHFNIADHTTTRLVLNVKNGHIAAETKSLGLNFSSRKTSSSARYQQTPNHTAVRPSSSTDPMDADTVRDGIKQIRLDERREDAPNSADSKAMTSEKQQREQQQSAHEQRQPQSGRQHDQKQSEAVTLEQKRYGLFVSPCGSEAEALACFDESGQQLIKSVELRRRPLKRQDKTREEKRFANVYVTGPTELKKLQQAVIAKDNVLISVLRARSEPERHGPSKKFPARKPRSERPERGNRGGRSGNRERKERTDSSEIKSEPAMSKNGTDSKGIKNDAFVEISSCEEPKKGSNEMAEKSSNEVAESDNRPTEEAKVSINNGT